MVSTDSFGADVIVESDLIESNPFTEQDRVILKSYEAVVDGLAALIGQHCEIVLHSLEDLNRSAIKIANGENTGRQVGSPITDLALRMLRDIEGSERNFSRAYFTRAKGNTLMKSITVAIRNSDTRIVGLLCININLDAPFSQVLQAFMPTDEARQAASSVNFASDVDELVDQTVERTIEEINADKSVSNNTKNRQIVMELFDKGIFDIKDAINRVADRLNISKHTVYLYIRQRKGEDGEK
ncbi:transcriptional regulator [Enterovibrio sp. ZSDZ35]|uniref:Transcriptional regulator n=1 Tax=Enterovibrio qingdaonensis TaxID=2899818 RepID=A0ABT5QMF2_9GAMM|nr:transcriptional regulator [Enterovibrio sp. ZSDZ35]MDD1782158.1 transcriptional regulator [Enterovibrio sp. ZSDZ35]